MIDVAAVPLDDRVRPMHVLLSHERRDPMSGILRTLEGRDLALGSRHLGEGGEDDEYDCKEKEHPGERGAEALVRRRADRLAMRSSFGFHGDFDARDESRGVFIPQPRTKSVTAPVTVAHGSSRRDEPPAPWWTTASKPCGGPRAGEPMGPPARWGEVDFTPMDKAVAADAPLQLGQLPPRRTMRRHCSIVIFFR